MSQMQFRKKNGTGDKEFLNAIENLEWNIEP